MTNRVLGGMGDPAWALLHQEQQAQSHTQTSSDLGGDLDFSGFDFGSPSGKLSRLFRPSSVVGAASSTEELRFLLAGLVPALAHDDQGRLSARDMARFDSFEAFFEFLISHAAIDQKSFRSPYVSLLKQKNSQKLLKFLWTNMKASVAAQFTSEYQKLFIHFKAQFIAIDALAYAGRLFDSAQGRAQLRVDVQSDLSNDAKLSLVKAIARLTQQWGLEESIPLVTQHASFWDYFNWLADAGKASTGALRLLDLVDEHAARVASQQEAFDSAVPSAFFDAATKARLMQQRELQNSPHLIDQMRAQVALALLNVANNMLWKEYGLESLTQRHALARALQKIDDRLRAAARQSAWHSPVQLKKLFDDLHQDLHGSLSNNAVTDFLVGDGVDDLLEELIKPVRQPLTQLIDLVDRNRYALSMEASVQLAVSDLGGVAPELTETVSGLIRMMAQTQTELWMGFGQHRLLSQMISRAGRLVGVDNDLTDIQKAEQEMGGWIAALKQVQSERDIQNIIERVFASLQVGGVLYKAFVAAEMDGTEQMIGLVQTMIMIAGLNKAGVFIRAKQGMTQAMYASRSVHLGVRASRGLKLGALIATGENIATLMPGQYGPQSTNALDWFKDAAATGMAMSLSALAMASGAQQTSLWMRTGERYLSSLRVRGVAHYAWDGTLETVEELVDAYLRRVMDFDFSALSKDEIIEMAMVSYAGGGFTKMGMVSEVIRGRSGLSSESAGSLGDPEGGEVSVHRNSFAAASEDAPASETATQSGDIVWFPPSPPEAPQFNFAVEMDDHTLREQEKIAKQAVGRHVASGDPNPVFFGLNLDAWWWRLVERDAPLLGAQALFESGRLLYARFQENPDHQKAIEALIRSLTDGVQKFEVTVELPSLESWWQPLWQRTIDSVLTSAQPGAPSPLEEEGTKVLAAILQELRSSHATTEYLPHDFTATELCEDWSEDLQKQNFDLAWNTNELANGDAVAIPPVADSAFYGHLMELRQAIRQKDWSLANTWLADYHEHYTNHSNPLVAFAAIRAIKRVVDAAFRPELFPDIEVPPKPELPAAPAAPELVDELLESDSIVDLRLDLKIPPDKIPFFALEPSSQLQQEQFKLLVRGEHGWLVTKFPNYDKKVKWTPLPDQVTSTGHPQTVVPQNRAEAFRKQVQKRIKHYKRKEDHTAVEAGLLYCCQTVGLTDSKLLKKIVIESQRTKIQNNLDVEGRLLGEHSLFMKDPKGAKQFKDYYLAVLAGDWKTALQTYGRVRGGVDRDIPLVLMAYAARQAALLSPLQQAFVKQAVACLPKRKPASLSPEELSYLGYVFQAMGLPKLATSFFTNVFSMVANDKPLLDQWTKIRSGEIAKPDNPAFNSALQALRSGQVEAALKAVKKPAKIHQLAALAHEAAQIFPQRPWGWNPEHQRIPQPLAMPLAYADAVKAKLEEESLVPMSSVQDAVEQHATLAQAWHLLGDAEQAKKVFPSVESELKRLQKAYGLSASLPVTLDSLNAVTCPGWTQSLIVYSESRPSLFPDSRKNEYDPDWLVPWLNVMAGKGAEVIADGTWDSGRLLGLLMIESLREQMDEVEKELLSQVAQELLRYDDPHQAGLTRNFAAIAYVLRALGFVNEAEALFEHARQIAAEEEDRNIIDEYEQDGDITPISDSLFPGVEGKIKGGQWLEVLEELKSQHPVYLADFVKQYRQAHPFQAQKQIPSSSTPVEVPALDPELQKELAQHLLTGAYLREHTEPEMVNDYYSSLALVAGKMGEMQADEQVQNFLKHFFVTNRNPPPPGLLQAGLTFLPAVVERMRPATVELVALDGLRDPRSNEVKLALFASYLNQNHHDELQEAIEHDLLPLLPTKDIHSITKGVLCLAHVAEFADEALAQKIMAELNKASSYYDESTSHLSQFYLALAKALQAYTPRLSATQQADQLGNALDLIKAKTARKKTKGLVWLAGLAPTLKDPRQVEPAVEALMYLTQHSRDRNRVLAMHALGVLKDVIPGEMLDTLVDRLTRLLKNADTDRGFAHDEVAQAAETLAVLADRVHDPRKRQSIIARTGGSFPDLTSHDDYAIRRAAGLAYAAYVDAETRQEWLGELVRWAKAAPTGTATQIKPLGHVARITSTPFPSLTPTDAHNLGLMDQLDALDQDVTTEPVYQFPSDGELNALVAARCEELVARLGDKAKYVREASATSLGQLASVIPAPKQPEVISGLVAGLVDRDGAICLASAISLGQMASVIPAPQQSEVISDLVAGLRDENWLISQASAISLGQLASVIPAPEQSEVINGLVAGLADRNGDVRLASTTSLGQMASVIPTAHQSEVINGLVARLVDRDGAICLASATSLGQLASVIPAVHQTEVINGLVARLVDRDGAIRRASATSHQTQVISGLVAGLRDEDEEVRQASAISLGQLASVIPAPKQTEVINGLIAGLADEDGAVRQASAISLGQLASVIPASKQTEVINGLIEGLRDETWLISQASAISLGQMASVIPAPKQTEVINSLVARLADEDGDVRQASAISLGQLSSVIPAPKQTEVINGLVARLADQGGDVRQAALGALIQTADSPKVQQVIDDLAVKARDTSDSEGQLIALENLVYLQQELNSAASEKISPFTVSIQEFLDDLKNRDTQISYQAPFALATYAHRLSLDQDQMEEVLSHLIRLRSAQDVTAERVAAYALEALADHIPSHEISREVEVFFMSLSDGSLEGRRALAAAFKAFAKKLDDPAVSQSYFDRAMEYIEDDQPMNKRRAATAVMGALVDQLDPMTMTSSVSQLLTMIEDRTKSWHLVHSAIDALAALAPLLSETQTKRAVDKLKKAVMNYGESDVRASAILAYKAFAEADRWDSDVKADAFDSVKAYFRSLGSDLFVKKTAIKALGVLADDNSQDLFDSIRDGYFDQPAKDIKEAVAIGMGGWAGKITGSRREQAIDWLITNVVSDEATVSLAAMQSLQAFARELTPEQKEQALRAVALQQASDEAKVRQVATESYCCLGLDQDLRDRSAFLVSQVQADSDRADQLKMIHCLGILDQELIKRGVSRATAQPLSEVVMDSEGVAPGDSDYLAQKRAYDEALLASQWNMTGRLLGQQISELMAQLDSDPEPVVQITLSLDLAHASRFIGAAVQAETLFDRAIAFADALPTGDVRARVIATIAAHRSGQWDAPTRTDESLTAISERAREGQWDQAINLVKGLVAAGELNTAGTALALLAHQFNQDRPVEAQNTETLATTEPVPRQVKQETDWSQIFEVPRYNNLPQRDISTIPEKYHDDIPKPKNMVHFERFQRHLDELAYLMAGNPRSHDLRVAVRLFGPPGTGKTTLPEMVAAKMGVPLMRFPFSKRTDPSDIDGQWESIVIDGERVPVFKEGVATTCMENGFHLVWDEPDLARAGVLAYLNNISAPRKQVLVRDQWGQLKRIDVHPDFRVWVTENGVGEVGRDQHGQDFLRRFVPYFVGEWQESETTFVLEQLHRRKPKGWNTALTQLLAKLHTKLSLQAQGFSDPEKQIPIVALGDGIGQDVCFTPRSVLRLAERLKLMGEITPESLSRAIRSEYILPLADPADRELVWDQVRTTLRPYLEKQDGFDVGSIGPDAIPTPTLESISKKYLDGRRIRRDPSFTWTGQVLRLVDEILYNRQLSRQPGSKFNFDVMMLGEAGEGKTVIPEQISYLLGLTHYHKTVSSETDEEDLVGGIGRINGDLGFVPDVVTEVATHGGVLHLDEALLAETGKIEAVFSPLMDDARALIIKNPYQKIPRHDDMFIIATSNTPWGESSDDRNEQSQAAMSRYAVMCLVEDFEMREDDRFAIRKARMGRRNVIPIRRGGIRSPLPDPLPQGERGLVLGDEVEKGAAEVGDGTDVSSQPDTPLEVPSPLEGEGQGEGEKRSYLSFRTPGMTTPPGKKRNFMRTSMANMHLDKTTGRLTVDVHPNYQRFGLPDEVMFDFKAETVLEKNEDGNWVPLSAEKHDTFTKLQLYLRQRTDFDLVADTGRVFSIGFHNDLGGHAADVGEQRFIRISFPEVLALPLNGALGVIKHERAHALIDGAHPFWDAHEVFRLLANTLGDPRMNEFGSRSPDTLEVHSEFHEQIHTAFEHYFHEEFSDEEIKRYLQLPAYEQFNFAVLYYWKYQKPMPWITDENVLAALEQAMPLATEAFTLFPESYDDDDVDAALDRFYEICDSILPIYESLFPDSLKNLAERLQNGESPQALSHPDQHQVIELNHEEAEQFFNQDSDDGPDALDGLPDDFYLTIKVPDDFEIPESVKEKEDEEGRVRIIGGKRPESDTEDSSLPDPLPQGERGLSPDGEVDKEAAEDSDDTDKAGDSTDDSSQPLPTPLSPNQQSQLANIDPDLLQQAQQIMSHRAQKLADNLEPQDPQAYEQRQQDITNARAQASDHPPGDPLAPGPQARGPKPQPTPEPEPPDPGLNKHQLAQVDRAQTAVQTRAVEASLFMKNVPPSALKAARQMPKFVPPSEPQFSEARYTSGKRADRKAVVTDGRPPESGKVFKRRNDLGEMGANFMWVADVSSTMKKAIASSLKASATVEFICGKHKINSGAILFAGNLDVIKPLGKPLRSPKQKDELISAHQNAFVDRSRVSDGTNIRDPLQKAIEMINKAKAKSNYIVLVTDGQENDTTNPQTLPMLRRLAHKEGIHLIVIALGQAQRHVPSMFYNAAEQQTLRTGGTPEAPLTYRFAQANGSDIPDKLIEALKECHAKRLPGKGGRSRVT